MRNICNKFLLKFDDPYMEKQYGDKSFRVTQGLIKINFLLDVFLFLIMAFITIYTKEGPIDTKTLTMVLSVTFLYICSWALLRNFTGRNFLVFFVIVGANVIIMMIILLDQRATYTRLIYLHYSLSSGYRVIKNLNSFMYIIAFNFFSVGFLAAIIYINLGRLTTESLDLIIWVLSPIFFCIKDWKVKSISKENLTYEFHFKKSYDRINKLLDNLPAGILISEESKVTYQSMKTRELMETAAPEHTFSKLQEVKVEMANIDSEKNTLQQNKEEEDGSERQAETERPLSNNLTDLFKGVDRMLPLQGFLRILLDKKQFRDNTYFEIPNATYKNKSFDLFLTCNMDYGNPSAIIVIIDSTVRNKRVFLEESDKYKTRVLGYISHFLKNPIHSIQDALSHFQNSSSITATSGLEGKLEMALANCQIISEMPNNIQILTDLINERLVVEKSQIHLKSMLKSIVREFKYSKRKAVQLTSHIEKDVPEFINSSERLLKAILKNLVTNSIKYTFSNYIDITVAPCKSRFEAIRFTARDLGKGIAKSKLDSIRKELNNPKESFDNFAELNIGLGMKVCYQLSKVLGPQDEKFVIESEEDQGTTVSFVIDISCNTSLGKSEQKKKRTVYTDDAKTKKITFLEVQKYNFNSTLFENEEGSDVLDENSDEDLSADNYAQNYKNRALTRTPKQVLDQSIDNASGISGVQNQAKRFQCCYDILVVDDDSFNLSVLRSQLEQKHWHVKTVHNGSEAINFLLGKCRNGHPFEKNLRLMITDIEMPIMGGIELMKKVRQAQSQRTVHDFPIVANTANINEYDTLQNGPASFDYYLKKPFSADQVTNVLHKLVKPLD
jgi:CheY-like chemotaxis protein